MASSLKENILYILLHIFSQLIQFNNCTFNSGHSNRVENNFSESIIHNFGGIRPSMSYGNIIRSHASGKSENLYDGVGSSSNIQSLLGQGNGGAKQLILTIPLDALIEKSDRDSATRRYSDFGGLNGRFATFGGRGTGQYGKLGSNTGARASYTGGNMGFNRKNFGFQSGHRGFNFMGGRNSALGGYRRCSKGHTNSVLGQKEGLRGTGNKRIALIGISLTTLGHLNGRLQEIQGGRVGANGLAAEGQRNLGGHYSGNGGAYATNDNYNFRAGPFGKGIGTGIRGGFGSAYGFGSVPDISFKSNHNNMNSY